MSSEAQSESTNNKAAESGLRAVPHSCDISPNLAKTLRDALAGGLHVDDKLPLQYAVAHVAAAQLRAIRFALGAAAEGHPAAPSETEDGRGWTSGDSFTAGDAVAALGGVMTILQGSADITRAIDEALADG